MLGLVTSVRPIDNRFMHSILTPSWRYAAIADSKFIPDTWVEFSGKEKRIDKDTKEIDVSSIKEVPEEEKERRRVDDYIHKSCVPRKTQMLIDDAVMRQLSASFEEAAATIKKAAFMHRPIIIRYDNDTDGLCAALSLYSALSDTYLLKVIEQPQPIYKRLNVEDDIRYMNSLEGEHLPPLLVCVDFGSNPESMDGYKKAREAGFTIVVIDHHPIQDQKVKQDMDVFVSAWTVLKEGATEYTAGLVASEVAKRIKDVDTDNLARIAMTGDRSKLFKPTVKDQKYNDALMFTISTSKYEQTIEGYLRLLNDEEMIDFAYAQAEAKIQTLLENLQSRTKRKVVNGVTFFLVDSGKLTKKGEYPGRSSVANIATDTLAKPLQTPAVLISYSGRNMSLRLNAVAIKQGYDSMAGIKAMKEKFPELVEAGGGHAVSSAMRVRVGYLKQILGALIKEISLQRKE